MEDLCHITETDDPAEEHGRDGHTDGEIEIRIPIRDQHRIFSKTVNDDIDQLSVKPQFYIHSFTGEHLEQPVGMVGKSFSHQIRARYTFFLKNTDVRHSVHPV